MIIRRAKLDDAKGFMNMLLQLDQETKYMMYEVGERNRDVISIIPMIESNLNASSILLLAEDDSNTIVGFLNARRGAFVRTSHSAYIAVGILNNYRNQGIATKFFEELDKWAINTSIKRLELTVMSSNEAAKHLYKKNGFAIEGVKRKSMFVDRSYIDEYYMAKLYI